MMRRYDRVILLELNEISSDLIRRQVEKGNLPNFSSVLDTWQIAKTKSESEYSKIEPWIQWVSAHTGKTQSEHGVFRLGDSDQLEHSQIWELLSDMKLESCVIGSMNASRGKTVGGIFLPDPWSKKNDSWPEDLRPLWELLSRRVQQHASTNPDIADLLAGLKTCIKYRVTIETGTRIVAQLVRQVFDPLTRWKLAGYFDLFLADVFISTLKSSQYSFYTLFLNSIAHYQHHFWRMHEPTKFGLGISCPDCRDTDDPISWGYQLYDAILGRIFKSIDFNKTLVMIASGLSQVPYLDKEEQGGFNYYRLRNHRLFVDSLGFDGSDVFPLMSRDWQVKFSNCDSLKLFEKVINLITVNGHVVFSTSVNADGFLFIETKVTNEIDGNSMVMHGSRSIGKFGELFIKTAVKSGHHTGIGSLYLSSPVLPSNSLNIDLVDMPDLILDQFRHSAEHVH